MSKKTVKSATTVLTTATRPLVSDLLAAHAGLADAAKSVDSSNKALAQSIDSKSGLNCRAFPLVDARPNAKFETFDAAQKKLGLKFTVADWQRAMAFVDELRTMHKESGSTVDFKTMMLGLKRHCMHWTGTVKSKDAVARAKKAKLANPEGKVKAKPKPKEKAVKVDALTATRQQIANVITCLNLLKDAKGVAGLPAKPEQEKAYELARELQEIFAEK